MKLCRGKLLLLLLLFLLSMPSAGWAWCEGRNIQYDDQDWATRGDVFRNGKKVATIIRGRSWYVWHMQCAASTLGEVYVSAQKAYWEACWRCPDP